VYQQTPAPLGGGLVKAEWFKHCRANERPESFERIVQSWDTANKATELSDFSVCTTWGIRGKDLFLLNLLRKGLEYPALKRAVREQHSLFNANVASPARPGPTARPSKLARAGRRSSSSGVVHGAGHPWSAAAPPARTPIGKGPTPCRRCPAGRR